MLEDVNMEMLQLQGTLRIVGNHQKLERQAKIFPWSLQREYGFSDTSITDLLPPELRNDKFLLF